MAESLFPEGLNFPEDSEPPHDATLLVRELLEQSGKYSEFIGKALSVNDTDLRAMEALMENGSMTAGQLAKSVGVSPGAATTVIDRLVAVGHVTRKQSTKDRRGVLVVPNPDSVESAWSHLAPIIAMSESTIRSMKPDEQVAVVKYLQAMIDIFSQPGLNR